MKPTLPFVIMSTSIYKEDRARIKQLVEQAKRNGFTATSESDVIRYAIRMLDTKDIPEARFPENRLAPPQKEAPCPTSID